MRCGGCIDKVRAHLLGLPACCNPFQWVKVGESLSWTQFDHLGLASHSSPGPRDQASQGSILNFSRISLGLLLNFSWITSVSLPRTQIISLCLLIRHLCIGFVSGITFPIEGSSHTMNSMGLLTERI